MVYTLPLFIVCLLSFKEALGVEYSFVYKSYQNSAYCTASSAILTPSTAEELQAIIQSAIASNQTVKVFGSRHSITDVICTNGIPVSTHNLNHSYFPDQSKETVTVGSGAELVDVLNFLQESGRTLVHVPAYGGITIGGAVGTGAHGSSLLHPSTISDLVVSLTVIDGAGNLRVINDTNELRAFRVHLGLLGALVDVTLKTVPLFKMKVSNYESNESVLLDGTALKEARVYDWYQLWWFPSSKSVVISNGTYFSPEESLQTEGDAVTNLIPDVSPAEIIAGRDGFELAQATKNIQSQYALEEFTRRSLFQEVIGKPPIFTEKGDGKLVNPAVGYAHRLQANKCTNKCAWVNGDQSILPEESAMAFEVEELPKVIAKMKEILKQIPAGFVMVGVFIRFSKGTDSLMGIDAERDTVHVEWTSPMRFDPYTQPREGNGAYQGILQAMVEDHDGRPHWGKNGPVFFSSQIINKRPSHLLNDFKSAMANYDPKEIFMNKFGQRVIGVSNLLTVDPSTKRCALQDYCICEKHADCGDLQVCSKVNGVFPVCKDVIPPATIPSLVEIANNTVPNARKLF